MKQAHVQMEKEKREDVSMSAHGTQHGGPESLLEVGRIHVPLVPGEGPYMVVGDVVDAYHPECQQGQEWQHLQ